MCRNQRIVGRENMGPAHTVPSLHQVPSWETGFPAARLSVARSIGYVK